MRLTIGTDVCYYDPKLLGYCVHADFDLTIISDHYLSKVQSQICDIWPLHVYSHYFFYCSEEPAESQDVQVLRAAASHMLSLT